MFSRMLRNSKMSLIQSSRSSAVFGFSCVVVINSIVVSQSLLSSCDGRVKSTEMVLTLPSGETYKGEVVDGKIHGHGVLTKNSEKYEGYFKSEAITGRFVVHYKNQEKYRGEMKDGVKHGYGSWQNNDEETYIGDWKNGKMEGKGVFRNHLGSVYIGEFKNNEKSGKGMEVYSNGAIYEGEYENNELHGRGIYRYPTGGVWEGLFLQGNRDDVWCFYRYGNGNTYRGGFRDMKKTGYGVFQFINGDIYRGGFLQDSFNGHGQYIYANGDIFTGVFENGQCLKGTLIETSGVTSECAFAKKM